MGHEFDDECACIHCGFDGAEWYWWRHNTYEGQASDDDSQPDCKPERRHLPNTYTGTGESE